MPSTSFFLSIPCGVRAVALLGVFLGTALAAEGPNITLGAAGWFNYGSIVSSSDTAFGIDVEGRPMISSGAQIVLQGAVSEHLDIQAGIGAAGGHFIAPKVTTQGGYSPYDIGPYVAQANFTYSFWKAEASSLFLRGGLFAYDYAEENQNLGLYLLRGPVYPGLVLSGFETKHVLPVANMLGMQLHHQAGAFQHDVLMQVETEFKPYYDVSLAYLATIKAGSAFRLTGGANYYHLISVDPSLTTDTTRMRWVDTAGAVDDTVQLSARAIKLMVNAAFDVKALFGGSEVLGAEDLKIYGEVALLGLENSKVYKDLYGPYSQRMPMMVGFNLPVFKLLDRLSLEVEYYGAPFKDDLKNFENTAIIKTSVIPIDVDSNYTKDNLKWSVYGSRTISNHIKLSLQVASDHFRPGVFTGYGDNNPPQSEAVLFSPSEWYWMGKVAYFF
ncbi:MAG: hypothetical protein ABIW76_11225, partial [Fibrobacteria bacterium]